MIKSRPTKRYKSRIIYSFSLIITILIVGIFTFTHTLKLNIFQITSPSTPFFADVPFNHVFYQAIEALRLANISGGCGGGNFCPDSSLTRAQAAVILLRAKHGGSYTPPSFTTPSFTDVPASHWAYPWIEQLKAEGITGGCNGTTTSFCPDAGVTRAEFAILLLRTKYGPAYTPTSSSTTFTDTTSHWARFWIEDLKTKGITTGCGGGTNFCPDVPVTRGEMAAFILRAFPALFIVPSPLPSPSPSSDLTILPPNSSYDVVIVGGGASGVAAAIQAARQNVKVALIEETDWLGGQMSAAAVSTMDEGIDHWQRTGGIYGEINQKAKSYYDARGITMSTCYHTYASFCPEPIVIRQILNELVLETRNTGHTLDVFYNKTIKSVLKNNQSVTGVVTTTNETVNAKVIIDATEYGDIIPLTGTTYRVGNIINSQATNSKELEKVCTQNLTYSSVITKYPLLRNSRKITIFSPDYDSNATEFRSLLTQTGYTAFDYINYPVDFYGYTGYRGMPNPQAGKSYYGNEYQSGIITKTGLNLGNDYPTNARFLTDKEYRQQIICKAKTKTLDLIGYIQNDLGNTDWGIDNTQNYNESFAPAKSCKNYLSYWSSSWDSVEPSMPVIPYIRESIRIDGIKTLGLKDIPPSIPTEPTSDRYTSARFDTAIAVADYAFDLHGCFSTDTLELDLDGDPKLAETPRIFQIPLETLIPQNLDGMIAAEKNISQSRLINGATRLQPTVMAVGQAAGSLAAHAVRLNTTPRSVNPILVQESLANSKLRLGVEQVVDVPSSYWAYSYLQLALAHNLTPAPAAIPPEGTIGARHKIDPETSITRGEAAYNIAQALSLKLLSNDSPTFTDTPITHPYRLQIEALYRAGLTSGCSQYPLQFCPDTLISRAEYAVLLSRALKLDTSSYQSKPSTFYDVNEGALWAKAHIEALYQSGVMSSCTSTPLAFCPNNPITRAQSWVLSSKLLLKTQPSTITRPPASPPAKTVTKPATKPPSITLAQPTPSALLPTLAPTIPVPLKGDLNHDNVVNFNDFLELLKNYNTKYNFNDFSAVVDGMAKSAN